MAIMAKNETAYVDNVYVVRHASINSPSLAAPVLGEPDCHETVLNASRYAPIQCYANKANRR